jgi:hypothetical protein
MKIVELIDGSQKALLENLPNVLKKALATIGSTVVQQKYQGN